MEDDFQLSLRTAIDSRRVDILNVILEDAKSKVPQLSKYINELYNGKTLLHYATEQGNVDAVRALLVSFNADPSVKNEPQQLTCYHTSLSNPKLAEVYHAHFLQLVTKDKIDELELCIKAGMDPNLEFPMEGAYLLHWACQYSNEETVNCLINHGANTRFIDSDGLTALHVAVKSSNEGALKALFNHGIYDLSIRSPFGDYRGFNAEQLCEKICPQFLHYFNDATAKDFNLLSLDQQNGDEVVSSENSVDSVSNDKPDLVPNGVLTIITNSKEDSSHTTAVFSPSDKESGHNNSSSLLAHNRNSSKEKVKAPWNHNLGEIWDLLVCPLPKLNNLSLQSEDIDFSSISEILVCVRNFKCWQKVLDLVSMTMNSLVRLGLRFNISVVSSIQDAAAHTSAENSSNVLNTTYPLHIILTNSTSASKPASYIFNMEKRKSVIKSNTVEGIRNGLATFIFRIMDKKKSDCRGFYDNSCLENRAVMYDFSMLLTWKMGIIYEIVLLTVLLKFNQFVIHLDISTLQSFKHSIESLSQRLIEIVVLCERFCLQIVPYLEISSYEIDLKDDFTKEMKVLKQLLTCFNCKERVIFGSNLTALLSQNQHLMDYTFYTLGLDSVQTDVVFCMSSVSAVGVMANMLPQATICSSKCDVIKEAIDCGMRIWVKSEGRNNCLIARAQLSSLLVQSAEASLYEGCFTVCQFATESVPLFVTCLPHLIINAEFSWNLSSHLNHKQFNPQFIYTIADELIFQQAPGFANALSLLSNVEYSLINPSHTSNEDGKKLLSDVSNEDKCGMSPILRWLEDPGLLCVERAVPHAISQAEKDLRSIFSFLEVHLHNASGAQPSASSPPVLSLTNPKLSFQTQTYLFQLRACANIALFAIKLLKSLYFAGRNPNQTTTSSSSTSLNTRHSVDIGSPIEHRVVSPTATGFTAAGSPGNSFSSVNLGVDSLSLQTKSDLANRLIVAMNDLKLIAQQELSEHVYSLYNQPSFKNILTQLVPNSTSV